MPEIGRYRDGERSSTELMQEAMEKAHAVDPGEGKKVEWHANAESMDRARARMHDESTTAAKYVVAGGIATATALVTKNALKEAPKLLNSPIKTITAGAVEACKWVGSVAAAEGAAGVAGLVGAGAAIVEVIHASGQGDELHERSDIDAMDVAVTNLLDLDPKFKEKEWANHPKINPESTMRLFKDSYGRPTDFGREHIPELQAAADAGAAAALLACKMGGKQALFDQNPEAARRWKDDVAFNKGFENVLFISAHEGAAEKLKALEQKLADRNAWNTVARPVQG